MIKIINKRFKFVENKSITPKIKDNTTKTTVEDKQQKKQKNTKPQTITNQDTINNNKEEDSNKNG